MSVVYYVEINLTCIILLLLLGWQLRHRSQFSTDRIAFHRVMLATGFLCASDIVAAVARGKFFWGARAILELSNLVYFELLTVIGYLWMIYVYLKLKIIDDNDKRKSLWRALPLIVFSAVALLNPFTHTLFSIDEGNIYMRNSGVYFHWVVTWLYLIVPTIRIARAIAREKNRQRRQEIIPLLYFIIAPSLASVFQMFFYGVSSSQVGITISITAVFLMEQNDQVRTDALTGLNNRRGLNNYVEDYLSRHQNTELSVFLMDLNNFKHVNDKLGHITGDHALLDVAEALKEVCARASGRLFLCRYGGDEFLIVGNDRDSEDFARLKTLVREEIAKKKQEGDRSYTLEVSIGFASGKCSDWEDVEHLLRMADEAMYEDKKRLRNSRAYEIGA